MFFDQWIIDASTLDNQEFASKYNIENQGALELFSVAEPYHNHAKLQIDVKAVGLSFNQFQTFMRLVLLGIQTAYDEPSMQEYKGDNQPLIRFSRDGVNGNPIVCMHSNEGIIDITLGFVKEFTTEKALINYKVPERYFNTWHYAFLAGYEEGLHSIFYKMPGKAEEYAPFDQRTYDMDTPEGLEAYNNHPAEKDVEPYIRAIVEKYDLGRLKKSYRNNVGVILAKGE